MYTCNDCETEAKSVLFKGRCYWCGSSNIKEIRKMLEDEFKLFHDKGKLTAVITIKGETYEMDVTDYFDRANPHDDWLDYRIGLKDLAEKSKLTKGKINPNFAKESREARLKYINNK